MTRPRSSSDDSGGQSGRMRPSLLLDIPLFTPWSAERSSPSGLGEPPSPLFVRRFRSDVWRQFVTVTTAPSPPLRPPHHCAFLTTAPPSPPHLPHPRAFPIPAPSPPREGILSLARKNPSIRRGFAKCPSLTVVAISVVAISVFAPGVVAPRCRSQSTSPRVGAGAEEGNGPEVRLAIHDLRPRNSGDVEPCGERRRSRWISARRGRHDQKGPALPVRSG